MHSDPIADLLTRIRNGLMSGAMFIDCPQSKIKVEIAKILVSEGFVKSQETLSEGKFPVLRVHLKYDNRRKPVIHKIRRVSKPGLRSYKSVDELRPRRSGLAIVVMTTSQGLMTDREARRRNLGGEAICEVY